MEAPNSRLLSIDAFRGFDMMFIMGLYDLVTGVAGVFGSTPANARWIPAIFHHVPWNGFHFIDSVFPTFLFIAGLSFPFSLARSRERGLSDVQIAFRTLKRCLVLTLLGLVYNGCLTATVDEFRFASVLQRIAVGWAVAALVFMVIRGVKARFSVFIAILFGWWALLQFVPAPGCPEGVDWMMTPVSEDGKSFYNLAVWFDHQLPRPLCAIWPIEPEGMLSHVGGVATAMIGMLTGEYLMRSRRTCVPGTRQCLTMWIAAAALLAIGRLMMLAGTPCIKAVWSSSFVCCVGSYSLAAFALFYYLIDVRALKGWTLFFRVIGMNSITVYLGQRLFSTWDAVHGPIGFLFGHTGENAVGLCGILGTVWGGAAWGVAYFATLWLVLYWLYRKNLFLKV